MTHLIIVHVQSEFPQSAATVDRLRRYVARHQPQVHQLVRLGEYGRRFVKTGIIHDSWYGEVPAKLFDQLHDDKRVVIAGGELDYCLERALTELHNGGIDPKLLRGAVYPQRPRSHFIYDMLSRRYTF